MVAVASLLIDVLLSLLIVGGLAVIWLAARNDRMDRWLSRVIARWLARYTDLDTRDYVRLMQLTRDYGITEMPVEESDWVAGRALAELDLFHEGVLVLGIHRRGAEYHGVPRGETERIRREGERDEERAS